MSDDPVSSTNKRRDYTNEIINTRSTHHVNKRIRILKTRWWLVLILALTIALTCIAVFNAAKPNKDHVASDLQTLQNKTNLPIFAPNNPPAGFSYKKNSATANGDVIIYSYTYNDNQTLSISRQPNPGNTSLEDFYNRVLSNKTNALSRYGKAVIGNTNGRTVGSLVTDKVWIILSSSSDINQQDLSGFISSLAPIE